MDCPEFETVQAFLSDGLPPDERGAVARHAENCPSCHELITALQATQTGAPAAAAEEPPGSVVGRYVIERRLGAGAMGVVYAATDPELARGVALKLLRVDSDERRARLVREAQALARISHPNVCTVHDIGSQAGRVFVAMELIDGQTLGAWLAERRPLRAILPVFVAAARGLAAAHAVGIVHRDFKPENVLIGKDGRVRVTDFGLAGWAAGEPEGSPELDTDLGLTQTGSVIGTPVYMSPEQHAGQVTDARSDQFSFFVALYEALYGERPFTGRTLGELAAATRHGLPAPPAGAPRWLERIVRRGLSASADDRHPSMSAVADALEHRRPRRLLLLGGAATVAVASAAVAMFVGRPARPGCAPAEATVPGVWDAARKTAAKDAFGRSGHPYADASWRAVEGRLDDYARRLGEGVAEACVAARVRGTQTEEMMALRLACLDERRAGLRAFTGALAAADVGVVGKAPLAAERLDAVDDCANAVALGATIAPPRAAAAGVAAARGQTAAARGLMLVAPWSVTQVVAQAAVAAADATGWAPVRAEARNALAEVQLMSRSAVRAEETLHEATRLAEEGRHDRARAEAAVLLSGAAASQKKKAEADRWAKTAEAVLARIGGDDDLSVRLDVDRGDIVSLERALARQIAAHGETSLRAGETLYLLAMQYDFGNRGADAEAARARADKIYAQIQGADPSTSYAPIHAKQMEALTGGDFAASVAYGEEGMAVMERMHSPDHPLLAEGYSTLSYAYDAADRLEDALAAKRRAISILERAGETGGLLAVIIHDEGTVLARLGRPAEALAAFEKALALAEPSAAPDDPLPAMCRSGMGEALVALGRTRAAVPPLERALDWREQHAAEVNAAQLGATRFALAKALWAERQRARSLELAGKALSAYGEHRAKFEHVPGWGQKAFKVANAKIGDVERWIEERRQ